MRDEPHDFFFALEVASLLDLAFCWRKGSEKYLEEVDCGLSLRPLLKESSSLQDGGCEADVNKNKEKSLWRAIVVVSLPSAQKKRKFLSKVRGRLEKKNFEKNANKFGR